MATSLRQALQTIYDEHGKLTPEIVVEAARDKRHPLHHRVFDVPVKLAAERYYRERAHELIQKAKVMYRRTDTSQPITLRAFHSIDHPDGPRFEPLDNVVNDPLLKALVLRDMEREWKQLHARYSTFAEFVQMVKGDLEATG